MKRPLQPQLLVGDGEAAKLQVVGNGLPAEHNCGTPNVANDLPASKESESSMPLSRSNIIVADSMGCAEPPPPGVIREPTCPAQSSSGGGAESPSAEPGNIRPEANKRRLPQEDVGGQGGIEGTPAQKFHAPTEAPKRQKCAPASYVRASARPEAPKRAHEVLDAFVLEVGGDCEAPEVLLVRFMRRYKGIYSKWMVAQLFYLACKHARSPNLLYVDSRWYVWNQRWCPQEKNPSSVVEALRGAFSLAPRGRPRLVAGGRGARARAKVDLEKHEGRAG